MPTHTPIYPNTWYNVTGGRKTKQYCQQLSVDNMRSLTNSYGRPEDILGVAPYPGGGNDFYRASNGVRYYYPDNEDYITGLVYPL